ncbi:MAG TPA: helix-turn-helix domain-containing protein [Polyangiaceae bacterium]|jgi:ribosome-binding protein aMBF1 (putative translation factor)
MPRETAFDRYFNEKMKKPRSRAAYQKARREIDAVDQIVRALDAARIDSGLSKAELARAISAKPEIVRRLFTSSASNPTLATVAKLAAALGRKLELVLAGPSTPKRATRARKAA